jgi:hypothetical protein
MEKKQRSRQAESWIYEVINPLLEVALPQENTLLHKHTWSWRFFSREFEFICPIKNYLPFAMWPIYGDFCTKYPATTEKFSKHDQILSTLSQQAGELFDVLHVSQEFQNKLSQCLQIWTADNSQTMRPGGACDRERFFMLMAENVINNLQDIPYYYANAQLVQQLSSTGEDLLSSNLELVKHLREVRGVLCEQYDVPAARVPGSAREQVLIAPDFDSPLKG